MDQLFGFEYIFREEDQTHFHCDNSDAARQNLERILKLATFYTIALFETDSQDQVIRYLLNGKSITETIPEACVRLYDKFSQAEPDLSADESVESSVESLSESDTESINDNDDSDENEAIDLDHEPNIAKQSKYYRVKNLPVATYSIVTQECEGQAWIHEGDESQIVQVTDFVGDSCPWVKIISRDEDMGETMGNYGSYTKYNKVVSQTSVRNYNMFDFDRFNITINQLMR